MYRKVWFIVNVSIVEVSILNSLFCLGKMNSNSLAHIGCFLLIVQENFLPWLWLPVCSQASREAVLDTLPPNWEVSATEEEWHLSGKLLEEKLLLCCLWSSSATEAWAVIAAPCSPVCFFLSFHLLFFSGGGLAPRLCEHPAWCLFQPVPGGFGPCEKD